MAKPRLRFYCCVPSNSVCQKHGQWAMKHRSHSHTEWVLWHSWWLFSAELGHSPLPLHSPTVHLQKKKKKKRKKGWISPGKANLKQWSWVHLGPVQRNVTTVVEKVLAEACTNTTTQKCCRTFLNLLKEEGSWPIFPQWTMNTLIILSFRATVAIISHEKTFPPPAASNLKLQACQDALLLAEPEY